MNTLSQQGKPYVYDVVVLGGGIAGLSYVLELSRLLPACKIALLTKKRLGESNSFYAQGGIAAAEDNADSIDAHVRDTLSAGAGLSHREIAHKILAQGHDAIKRLAAYGVPFDAELHLEGGHGERRIYCVGDYSGRAIIETLCACVKRLPNVDILCDRVAVNLIMRPAGGGKEVIGVYVLDCENGLIDTFAAKATVIATGGAGKIYQYTSNPATATGDGIAMAWRVGARIANMEFYQFHPTLLYHKTLNNFLISEALRGEGAYLRRPSDSMRFMADYAPERMEMATRDVVARAIFNEIDNSDCPYIHLDIRHRPATRLARQFPDIDHTLKSVGIDMAHDKIPVVPAAHYLCGGIVTDDVAHTDLSRLYAIGETACIGLHGANRLASNSLLEGAVMACFAAQDSARRYLHDADCVTLPEEWHSEHALPTRRSTEVSAHWRGLRGEMMSYAGIVRNERDLTTLLRLIETRREMIEAHYWRHAITADLVEARNIVLVAELIVRAALRRRESRGGHYRSDYPETAERAEDSIEQKHT